MKVIMVVEGKGGSGWEKGGRGKQRREGRGGGGGSGNCDGRKREGEQVSNGRGGEGKERSDTFVQLLVMARVAGHMGQELQMLQQRQPFTLIHRSTSGSVFL